MAVSVQTFANGDVDYIAKHNANNQNVKVAIEALQSAIAAQAGGGGGGGTTAVSYEALFGTSDAVLGEGSYEPTQASADNLDTAAGYAYVAASDAVVSQGSTVTLDFQGQTTGTYYIHVDNAGVPSFDQVSADSLYSVSYDSGTGNFDTITRTGNLAWTYVDWENTQTNIWGIVYDGLDTRLSSIEGASYGVLQKTATATNITLTDREALEQSLIEISDGPQTVDIDLIVPAQARIYQIVNNASTTYGITLKVTGEAGYQVMGNHFAILYCDGTNTVALFDLDLASGGEPPNKFKVLKDTPSSYTGNGGKLLRVNAVPDGIEYFDMVWGEISGTLSNQTDLQSALDGKSGTGHDHSGTYEPADATIIKEANVDDVPVDAATVAPISSNWAYDHENAADPHPGYLTPAEGDSVYLSDITAEPFIDLSDTPANYTSAANYTVKVNGAGNALVFVDEAAAATVFPDLTDTPANYSGAGGYTVKVKAGADGLEFVDVSAAASAFTGLTDTPADYTGGVGSYFVKVNSGATALEFVVNPGYLTNITGENFTALNDSPANYTGAAKHAVKVNAAGTALEFVDDPYFVSGFFPGTGVASATLLVHVFAAAVDFPSGLTNSQGTAETAATAQTDYDIKKNGSSVGTMRFAAAATTATFIMASATSFAAGDKLQLVAPGTLDSTLADIAMTLEGTR